MEINIFPHLSAAYSMNRYFKGITRELSKLHSIEILTPVPTFGHRKISILSKYPGYLRIAAKAKRASNLILSERFSFLVLGLRSKETVVICHDMVTLLNQRTSRIHKFWYRLLMRFMSNSRWIVCISESTKNDLLTHCKFIDENRVRVIYNGIEQHWFLTEESTSLPAREEIGTRKFFLMVGTDAWNKNFDAMIEALRFFSQPDFILVKVGALSDEHKLRLLSAGFEKVVVHIPGISDAELKWLYKNSVALVFPSLHEGFGWPVLEAMACGCPVIASSKSSIPEVAGSAALYIDPYKPDSIQGAMSKLLSDAETRQSMILTGREQATKFSWERTASQLVKLFNE